MLVRCPHCLSKVRIRNSLQAGDTVRALYVQCLNLECAWTGKGFLSIVETIAPSMMPNPKVHLPLSPRSPAAEPSPTAQLGLALNEPPHPRAVAYNTS